MFQFSKASLGPYAWQSSITSQQRGRSRSQNAKVDQPLPLKQYRSLPVVDSRTLGHHISHGQPYLDHEDLRDLERSADVFGKIYQDPIISCDLPRPSSTSGKILEHATKTIERLLRRYSPMTFKFGITHDASVRWHNPKFGYKVSKERFARMHVLYAASNPTGPSFLEAALIAIFSSSLIALERSKGYSI